MKLTGGSPEVLPVKIVVPMDKINQNRRKIPVKELIFTKVANKIPAILIKMNYFR